MFSQLRRFVTIFMLIGAAIGYRVYEKMVPNEYAWVYGIATWLMFCLIAGVIYLIAVSIKYTQSRR